MIVSDRLRGAFRSFGSARSRRPWSARKARTATIRASGNVNVEATATAAAGLTADATWVAPNWTAFRMRLAGSVWGFDDGPGRAPVALSTDPPPPAWGVGL